MSRFLTAIVNWLRAGYPEGVPRTDYIPVLALLSRRLSTDEVKAVANELMRRGDFDNVDIGVAITQITDDLPTAEDIERVRERLAAKGWPLDDPRDGEDADSHPACPRRPGRPGSPSRFARSGGDAGRRCCAAAGAGLRCARKELADGGFAG